jgi:adenylate cyclase class 2
LGRHQPAVHRSILVIDVEKFGDPARTNADQVVVRDGMYQALAGALADAGISRPGCLIEDRGDGALVLISPQVPKSRLVTRLPIQLAAALGAHNATCPANARIRLRMALHGGEVHPDAHGVTGSAVNKTFRLVEAPALKSALDGSAGVLALIVSDWFYDEVVRHDPAAEPGVTGAPAGWQFGDSKLGVSFLRLRTVQGRHYFTLKQPADNAQDCLEYETQVADRQAMHHAALHMGYRPTVRIAKTRRMATLDDCSLCIDEVEGVGGFLELERMAPDHADAQAIQADLAAFVSSLGIAATRTDQTYDSLVHAAQE